MDVSKAGFGGHVNMLVLVRDEGELLKSENGGNGGPFIERLEDGVVGMRVDWWTWCPSPTLRWPELDD